MATVAATTMTADEFAARDNPGHPEELVQGRVVAMPPPDRRHGFVCGQAYFLLRVFVEAHDLGRVMTNDSAVVTERDPDTVRGADVAFYSYDRLPKGPLPPGYGPEVPELVVEVRSPGDRWARLHEKVAEYLHAGVLAVVVLDPDARSAHLFAADAPPRALGPGDVLALPDVLPGFLAPLDRFFE